MWRRFRKRAPDAELEEELQAHLEIATKQLMERGLAREQAEVEARWLFGSPARVAIGIYGLMAYSVQQRTREIGIRLALGADTSDVHNMIVFQGIRLALIGAAIGIAAAFALTRLIASFLFGVKPWDPMVFIAVPVVLSAVALLAVWLPALRASRVDPIEALRYE